MTEATKQRKCQVCGADSAAKVCADCVVEQAKAVTIAPSFGITPDDYKAMMAAQQNRCAICRQRCSSGRRLAIDHDHVTGAVRGLLCGQCNRAIGLLADDIGRFVAAAEYLHRHGVDAPARKAVVADVKVTPCPPAERMRECPRCRKPFKPKQFAENGRCKACAKAMAWVTTENDRRRDRARRSVR